MRIVLAFLFALICFATPGNLFAQQDAVRYNDVVLLKDGSKLVGTIRKWDYEHAIYLLLPSGAEVMIPKGDLLKVQQVETDNTEHLSPGERMKLRFQEEKSRPYSFREKGLYGTLTIGFNRSPSGSGSFIGSFGYRFNRFLGVGLSSGIDLLNGDRSHRAVPALVELRGFMLKHKISPYYVAKGGAVIPVYDRDLDGIAGGEPGYNLSGEIGVRFGDKRVNYILGVEFQFAKASYRYEFPWDPNQNFTDDLIYRRINFRTGIQF